MTDRFEETFEALLGSARDKMQQIEQTDEEYAGGQSAAAVSEHGLSDTEVAEAHSGHAAPTDSDHAHTIDDAELSDSVEADEATEADVLAAHLESPDSDTSASDWGVATEVQVERYIKLAKGAYLVPNYVSDYLMKNLSLGEQSVFQRLYRLSRGFHKKTEPITVRSLAESCGLNPKLTANIIKALASKRILKIIYSNPFTKKVKFKLVLPREVEQKMIVCGVCHNLIMDDEEWKYFPITVPVNGRAQAISAHVECVEGEAFLESETPT